MFVKPNTPRITVMEFCINDLSESSKSQEIQRVERLQSSWTFPRLTHSALYGRKRLHCDWRLQVIAGLFLMRSPCVLWSPMCLLFFVSSFHVFKQLPWKVPFLMKKIQPCCIPAFFSKIRTLHLLLNQRGWILFGTTLHVLKSVWYHS